MTQALNFQSLDDFVQREPDDISTIQVWFEKLSEYELDGSESPKDLDTLIYALRYLMNYSFTAAEELKEVAEQEAVAMAEKEEQWEEQRQATREEIEELRQRITVRADATESSEAFVAQIDSLKEENRNLQQLSRDRDMEMADQRDRFESLVSRADQLTRERDALMDHKAQMEDTIRELNRRISSKSEEVTNEWETKKLKLRNEQAVTLSKQMQAVVAQNDQLRSEVDRVSDALEEATRLIEDSSARISEVSDELKLTQKRENQLNSENKALREKLETASRTLEELEAEAMDTDEILKKKINQQTDAIGELQQRLYEAQVEVEELRGRIRADTTEEKEAELEKLKQELITATKMARTLLGQESTSKGEQIETTDWPRRLMQAEHRLQEAHNKISEMKKSAMELEDVIVQRETSNGEVAAELERLRELKFGSAREELDRLGQQLKIRDEQIGRLTRHCTLLQVELGRYAEKGTPRREDENQAKGESPKFLEAQETYEQVGTPDKEKEKAEEGTNGDRSEPKVTEDEEETYEVETKPLVKPKTLKVIETRTRSEYEQQSMIIAGLNFELMTLIEELEAKNRQLVEMEHSLLENKRRADEGRGKLKLAYEEVASLRTKEHSVSSSGEESQAEISELRRFAETIRFGGSEMERRTEEVTRKLISEKIERVRISRSEKALRSRCLRATEGAGRLRERLISTRQIAGKQTARIQYELDMTCYELASIQNKLLHSVSLKQFEELSKKYRELLKKETVGGGTVDDTPSVDFDVAQPGPEEDAVELSAKNKYLKKMVDILSEQNEFWSNETDILQKENKELKRFLEDLENESDAKGVLVSVESRLIESIRELSEMAKEQTTEHRKMRDAEETLARQKDKWHSERKHFIHIISMLQNALKTQRNNNLSTITVTQMEALRAKIVEIDEEKGRVSDEKERAEKIKEQLEIQLTTMKSLKKARDLVETKDADRQRLERALRDAFTAERVQTAKVERLQHLLKSRESAETQKNEELMELRRHNEELLSLVGRVSETEKKRGEEKPREEERRREDIEVPESEYEMDYDSSESSSSSSSERIEIPMGENSKDRERRLQQIRETAETIIRSYKDQLSQKDAAIESYRELLLVKINEVSSTPKERKETVREEKRGTDEQTENNLRKARHEIVRLKEEVEELEAANRNLYKERRKSVVPTTVQASTQTEDDENAPAAYSQPTPLGIITPIPEETERSRYSDQTEAPQGDNVGVKHKNEMRKLRERINRLTVTNKNLLIACEKIKEEAMVQLAANAKRQGNKEDLDNSQTRAEVVTLRTEIRLLKRKLKERDEEIQKLAKEVEGSKKNAQEEVWKWEQRKKTEERIVNMRKRLKEAEEREEILQNKLSRREKRLEEMGAEAEERRKELARMSRMLAETKTERERSQKESQQNTLMREKQVILEKKIQEREKELIVVNGRLKNVELRNKELSSELTSLKKKLDSRKKEIESTVENTLLGEKFETRIEKSREIVTNRVEKQVVFQENSLLVKRLEEQLQEMKKKLRVAELRYTEVQEHLEAVEAELSYSRANCEKLMKRLSMREEHSGGAVAVLSDKLSAKEREISKLKAQVVQLERRLSR